MPCSDVTETIEVVLDADDRLKSYALSKRTCGRGVGHESLLIEQLEGRSLETLLHIDVDTYLDEFPVYEEIEEFLSLKHLFAIQGALEVLTGKEPGGDDDPFMATGVTYGVDETSIEGLIDVDLITEKIDSCGGCKGCGSAARKKAEAAAQ